ncbi:MAG: Do family serine endopeptidase [Burkholderiales bacterium]
MRKLWLLFAQSVAVTLGVLLAVSVIRPEWLKSLNGPSQPAKPVISVAQTQAGAGTAAAGVTFSNAAKQAMPAVVNIFTSKEVRSKRAPFLDDPMFRRFFGDRLDHQEQRQSSLGSGVIVSQQGFILTNHHVVEAADEIQVALADGRDVPAKLVGADPETDLAVLKVDLKDLPAITFGSSEELRIGDVVLAIGNPFGVGQTVTMGIVSAVGRSHLGINTFENFIQTDAAINPGNSGGALIDVSGHLVGINSAIYSRSGGNQGIGFTIPVSLAKKIMEQIIQSGFVTRGWIGVEVQDVTPELADSFNLGAQKGALIAGVLRNAPADRADIKPGDIVVDIEGKPVVDSSSLLNLISDLPPNMDAKIKLIRDQNALNLKVKIGTRPKAEPAER